MIKVDIISGFLGAGKTTFIKELTAKVFQNEKVVLIENEFGEIGIDSRFMQDAGIEVTEMNSGCICCTLVGDFAKALKQVAEVYAPDRVLIEPSGVGKLSDVAQAVRDMEQDAGMHLNRAITIVDGKKIKLYMKNFGEFYKNQVEHADTLVVSRSQMLDEEKLRECVSLLREENSDAELIVTPWDQLSGETLRSAIDPEPCSCGCGHEHHTHGGGEDCGCGRDGHSRKHHENGDCGGEHGHAHHHGEHHHEEHHREEHCCGHEHEQEHHAHHEHESQECGCGHHHGDHDHHHDHHHADEIFDTWGAETVHRFSRAELEDVLKMLSVSEEFGTVLRAKGIVACDDGTWMEFDMVPEELEIRTCSPDPIGKLCVIGTELSEDGLKQLFGQ